MKRIIQLITELMLLVTIWPVAGLLNLAFTTHAPQPACPHMIFVPVRWR